MALNAKLVVVGGEVKTAEIKLRLPSTIGRGRGTTIMLPHPLVSRQHCELFEANGKLMVRDMGSLNGTFVNNQRITESVIEPGELLTIGAVTFRAAYEVAGAPPAASGESPSDTNIAARSPLESTLPASDIAAGDDELVEDFGELEIEEVEVQETSSVSQPMAGATPSGINGDVVDVPEIEDLDEGGATRMANTDPRATQPAPAKSPAKAPAANAPAGQKGVTPPSDDDGGGEDEDDLQDFLNSLK